MNPDKPHEDIYLTVVVPVLDEAESLPHLCEGLHPVLEQLAFGSEVVFVDDGSSDQSFEVLRRLHRRFPYIRALRFRRNQRKAAALAAGFQAARGAVVVTMDADLQDDPKEIPRLLAELEGGLDLVSGWKKRRRDPLSKTLPSRLFNRVTSWVSGIRLHDFNCGLKAYRHGVTRDVLPYLYGELYRYLPAIAHWNGYHVGEIPVEHHPRRYGTSKFGARRLVSGFLDLLTVTFVVRFMNTPMHIFGSLGLISMMSGCSICTYVAILRYQFGNIQHRYPLLLLGALLIIVGIQFLSTGLLGDMLASIHQRGRRTTPTTDTIGDPHGAVYGADLETRPAE